MTSAGRRSRPTDRSIAFHESDDDGGIFVAGATGESVRRLTDFGFDPAWSPDGKHIAFTTEEIIDPGVASERQHIVRRRRGRRAATQGRSTGTRAQPSWSPSGERIVYWRNTGGQRDIYTVAAAGGAPLPLTQDPRSTGRPCGRRMADTSTSRAIAAAR